MTNYKDFAKKVKEKYPQYAKADDRELAEKMIAKFPEYKGKVDFKSADEGLLRKVQRNVEDFGDVAGAKLYSGVGQTAGAVAGLTTKVVGAMAQGAGYLEGGIAKGVGSIAGFFGDKKAKEDFHKIGDIFYQTGIQARRDIEKKGMEINAFMDEASRETEKIILKNNEWWQGKLKKEEELLQETYREAIESGKTDEEAQKEAGAALQDMRLSDWTSKDFLLGDVFGSFVENAPTMALTYAVGKGAGASTGGMGTVAKFLAQVTGSTGFSTGVNAYREGAAAYNQAKAEGLSDEDAAMRGERVLERNFKGNLTLEGGQMLLLFASTLSPGLKNASPFLRALATSPVATGLKIGVAGGIEAGQERMEDVIQAQAGEAEFQFAELYEKMVDRNVSKTDVISFLMGAAFQGLGNAMLREEDVEEAVKKHAELVLENMGATGGGDPVERLAEEIKQNPAAVEEAVREAQTELREMSSTVETKATGERLRAGAEAALAAGESPAKVTLDLANKIGAAEATALVEEIQAAAPQAPAPVEATAVADTAEALKTVDEAVLEQTPADLQAQFTKSQEDFEANFKTLEAKVDELKKKVDEAKPRTAGKARLKKELVDAKKNLEKAEKEFLEGMSEQAENLRGFLEGYIPKTYPDAKLDDTELSDVIDEVVLSITDPERLKRSFAMPLRDVVASQVAAARGAKEVARKVTGKKKAKKPEKKFSYPKESAEAAIAEAKQVIEEHPDTDSFKKDLERIEERVKAWGKEKATTATINGREVNRGDFVQYGGRVMIFDSLRSNGQYLLADPDGNYYYAVLAREDHIAFPSQKYVKSEYERVGWPKPDDFMDRLGELPFENEADQEAEEQDEGEESVEEQLERHRKEVEARKGKPQDPAGEGYTRYEIEVDGVKMYADLNREWGNGMAHIAFQSLLNGEPNPLTETGYRSHFVDANLEGMSEEEVAAAVQKEAEKVLAELPKKKGKKKVDKKDKKGDDEPNEPGDQNSGGGTDGGGVPQAPQDSADEPGGAGTATPRTRPAKRGQERPAGRGGKPGKRPGARLTNEEVTKIVNEVTAVDTNGEVSISGEITDEVREAANQYIPGGTAKEGRGILDEYYTDQQVVDMAKSLLTFPAEGLKVLEPAAGTGNFLYSVADVEADVTAHEINETTARIAKIFHPNARVTTRPFEDTFIDERGNKKEFKADYDLVIGNPPYGEHRGKYLGLGEAKEFTKYEEYFIARGLSVLKNGGHLVMVVPSSFIRSGESKTKISIIARGELVTAFRLPNGVFKGTDVGTDIVVFKKVPAGYAGSIIPIVDDGFFKENPANVLGVTGKRKGQFGMEPFVKGTLEDAISLFYQNKDAREAIAILKDLGVEATPENVENAEAAVEETGKDEAAEALVKQAQKKGKETIEKKVVKKAAKTGEPVSLISKFAGEFTDAELEAWRDTLSDGSLKNPEKHKAIANFMGGKWYIDFNYAQGDIYEKLEALERDKKTIGAEQYKKQKALLEAVKPTPETIEDLRLSPNIAFVNDLELGGTEEAEFGQDEEARSLRSAFLRWVTTLPHAAFGGSSQWEVRGYVNNEVVRGSDKDLNEKIRVRRKRAADDLFAKFMKEGLTDEERQLVADAYNRTFNFYHTPDYKKVPMFSLVHPTFKGSPLNIRDVQKHGIGRLINTGVGILAHDVGFGKTMSGVLAISETIHRGWAKRPLVVAPNENVYRQWVETIEDLIPDAKLNLLGNLGVSYKGDLSSLEIPEGSITLLTYEGFKRLGFSDDTYARFGGKFHYITDDLEKHKTERDRQKDEADAEAKEGKMKKGTRADLSFEALGFDHITFDEVHNANHIVSKVKLDKDKASEFSRFSLRPSDLGIKTWLAAQYIQDRMNGRNVNLLSATPFTNHPLEYYSILSLVADRSLQRMGLTAVNDFFGTFMEAENEYEFKADGSYQKKTDIRRFRNYRQFRKLLDTYIDFKEGEGHGMVRPERVQQTYEIPQNQFGLDMELKAQEIFKEDEREEGKGAKVLRAITELRKIAFSPYASKFAADISPEDYKKFVEDSPKILALMRLIAQNKADKEEAGQIVYVDQVGVEFLPLMRDYLIKEVGYKPEEVEIISGATAKNRRLEIQDSYNKGDVKVILGSEAIKEGMNLQENTTDLYIMSLPWNFTQLRQVIGRAWRQGNRWANVRINNLFIQDSIDIFLSQKLENKQKRYEAAIKSGDQEVDVGDVSFNELKFDLVRDPETRAKLELAAEKERLEQSIAQEKAELAFATRRLEKIAEIEDAIRSNQESIKDYEEQRAAAVKEGKETKSFDFWIDKYERRSKDLKKELKEQLDKLAAKGIDIKKLMETKEAGEKKVAELEGMAKVLSEGFDAKVKEIAATLPERKPFSLSIVDALVAERAEQNKTFYSERVMPAAEEVVAAEVVEKPIKSVSGKVVKTKKAVKTTRSSKVTGETKDTATLKILTDTALSTNEKVDKLLDVKQKGKKFKDVGERVVGSAKERAAIRAVMDLGGTGDVFAEIVNRLGVEAVMEVIDKNEILKETPKPDPEADRKAGVPALVSFTKKDIYDKIQRKFSFEQGRGRWKNHPAERSPEDRQGFRHAIDAQDTEYAAEVLKEYPALLREFVTKLAAVKDVDGLSDFWSWYDGSYGQGRGREIGRLNGEIISVDMEIFGSAVADYKAFVPAISTWNDDKSVYLTRGRLRLFKVQRDDAKKDGTLKIWEAELKNDKWWEKAIKKVGAKEDTELKHGNFKPLERVERSGEPIPEKKVAPKTLTEDYGFKSVQFGNYMDDATAKEHIRYTIGALEDMAELLDLDIAGMVSKTGLSMAYGARGHGGANAHYEPGRNIINLTKGKGDGSFFHEFTHYLDLKLGEGSYRGRWSSKKERYYRIDTLDKATLDLMNGLTGRHGWKKKTFEPSEDPYIRDSSPVPQWHKEGMSLEDAIAKAAEGVYEWRGDTKVFRHTERDLLQNVADVYRETFDKEVEVWNDETEYYKRSKKYGGDYWGRPEELLARAAQAYIEDKMIERGMKNNYLTRSTIAESPESSLASVYPQGDERKRFNALFDAVFAELRRKFPRNKPKLKAEGKVSSEYALTEAGKYLADVKKRLALDFDVHFVDNILSGKDHDYKEAYGATFDNTIALVRNMAEYTAEHEVVHLTLANMNRIDAFRREGVTREEVLRAKAKEMGIELTGDLWADSEKIREVEEQLALDFEAYIKGKHDPKGIIRKFFAILRRLLVAFARAIKATQGDIITNYYDILLEGRSIDREMTRLENKGVMAAYIEDGVLDISDIDDAVTSLRAFAPRIERTRAEEISLSLLATDNIGEQADIINRLSDEELAAFLMTNEANPVLPMLEGEIARLLDDAKAISLDFRFKVKGEGDARLAKLKKEYNELANLQGRLERDREQWKKDIDVELAKGEAATEAVEEVEPNVKEAARFTKRTEPVGELTSRGEMEIEELGFANKEEAQKEITEYLRRKTELIETRNRLRTLRRDIAAAGRQGREAKRSLRDVERKLRLRKALLERKDFYVGIGVTRGRKLQMRMIWKRGRALRNVQDTFAIGDTRAKKLIGGRRIHLMTENEFDNFLLEFANKARDIRNTLDARDEVKAIIEEKDLHKADNLREAMGLPPIEKMTDTQANRFAEVLSLYQFGDTFLTKRELETIHRTQWGEMKTERELLAKLKEHTGTGLEEMRTLTGASPTTPWIKLARSHPFYNWLVGKRVEAAIKAEREYTAVEEQVNKLTRAARHSRRQKMGLGERAVDVLVPTDDIVFGYMEAKEKEAYAKAKDMTEEELTLAAYLIKLYYGAYEYLNSEYGMRERKNYMTHIRRSFFEAMKESGVKAAFREIWSSQVEEEAAFKILEGETGEVLAFEKFFGYALARSGALVPSKNIARATLAYFQAFSKKKALDEFIPEAMVAVQAHKAVVGTTPKGLTKDPTLEAFVKTFLNDAKGRKADVKFGKTVLLSQGSKMDRFLRAFTAWISIKFLGLNLATAVASFIGDFTAIFWELSVPEVSRGIIRSLNITKAHEINKAFRFFTGRNPLVELFDPKFNMPSRLKNAILVLMAMAPFQSNKFFLRSKMTAEEWQTGVLEDKRLKEIALSLSRVKPNPFYIKSLAGNTSVGKATFQFGTWAVAIWNSVTSDSQQVYKMLRDKKGWEAVTSKEAQKIAKFAIMAGMAGVLAALVNVDEDDDGYFAQIMRKAKRELTTLVQALQFVTDIKNYAIIVRELGQWSTLIQQLVTWETYKQDGVGYGIGDPKWTRTGERLITPSVLKQFFPEEDVDTKEDEVAEAVKRGSMTDEEAARIAEKVNPDGWNNVEGTRDEKEQEIYRQTKIGEIQALFHLRQTYPESELAQIILDGRNNDEKIEKMIEYSHKVGMKQAFDELKVLFQDRNLCSSAAKKTGCLVSGALFKEFQIAKNKLKQ